MNGVFDKVTCSKCQQVKGRLKTKTQYRNKTWFYLDEKARRWEGLICPDCLRLKNKNRNEKVKSRKLETRATPENIILQNQIKSTDNPE